MRATPLAYRADCRPRRPFARALLWSGGRARRAVGEERIFPLERDAIDRIAAGMIDTLNDRDEGWGPFDHDEMADMVDDWFDARRIEGGRQ